mmetsp:Transcript_20702/g.33332  ORF Transcript_20702/g.33332 Transcript_20702/m.33332 type:complete len:184 (-) Transcript_20702:452-1003(-)
MINVAFNGTNLDWSTATDWTIIAAEYSEPETSLIAIRIARIRPFGPRMNARETVRFTQRDEARAANKIIILFVLLYFVTSFATRIPVVKEANRSNRNQACEYQCSISNIKFWSSWVVGPTIGSRITETTMTNVPTLIFLVNGSRSIPTISKLQSSVAEKKKGTTNDTGPNQVATKCPTMLPAP